MNIQLKKREQKIGVGIITCNRIDFFRECLAGVPDTDILVVVNDGEPYPTATYPSRVTKVIQHRTNKGVGRSKNDALRWLLKAGCSDYFIVEDDIRIINPNVCQEYIRASRRSGIRHFNFAYHGFENKSSDGHLLPPRKIIDYGTDVSIALHHHILGAFQYFTDDVLRECGLMDPCFRNMIEHVEHTYRIIQHGFHPPFWWFADLFESNRFFHDLDPNHKLSTIRSRKLPYRIRMRLSELYFALKHGSTVMHIRDASEQEVDAALFVLKQKFGINDA